MKAGAILEQTQIDFGEIITFDNVRFTLAARFARTRPNSALGTEVARGRRSPTSRAEDPG